jgi:BASS family bile acid:Na+ symporter
MKDTQNTAQRISGFLHHHFLKLLILSYLVAAFLPAPGLWLRERSLGDWRMGPKTIHFLLPSLLLSGLLFNAGLGLKVEQVLRIGRSPAVLVAGLAVNTLVPLLFIAAVAAGMSGWHDRSEVQCILLGLALVASMPVAGSSTSWTQNTNGDLALGLGLVLGSTLLSPFMAPLSLELMSRVTEGEYRGLLLSLGGAGTGYFLAAFVLCPTILGLLVRQLIANDRWQKLMPAVKSLNTSILLTLCYSNAAVSLPEVVINPDWDFLAATCGIVIVMCVLGFAAGALVSKICRSPGEQRTALMFGLGMNNNGTALVIASLTFAGYPRVLLPVIFYNLVQHLIAGFVARMRTIEPQGDVNFLSPEAARRIPQSA